MKHLGCTLVAALGVAPSVLGARTPVSRLLSSRVLTYLGAISYGIVREHEGSIRCDSAIGHGTRFTLSMPLTAVAANRRAGNL